MGCGTSKVDDLPAVQLCRHRLNHLSSALHHRYLLSDAHLSYIHSLEALGLSLHHFFNTAAASPPPKQPPPPPSSPPLKINNNNNKNNNNNDNSGHLSSSHSGSHLDFHSSDDEDDDDHLHDHESGSGSGRIHELEQPPRRSTGGGGGGMMIYEENGFNGFGGGGGPGYGPGFDPVYSQYSYPGINDINNISYYNNNGYNINYMKKHVTPSVSYEQRPVSYETQTLHFGGYNNNNYYDNFGGPGPGFGPGYMGPPPWAQRDAGVGGGGGYGGGWSNNNNNGMAYQQMGPTKEQQQAAPPPPPSPPGASPWDFMNLFSSIEETYPYNRTPSSKDSREVREEEGIPELEDEDSNEVVKQVLHGHQKLVVDEGGESSVSSVGGEGSSGGDEARVRDEVMEVVGKGGEGGDEDVYGGGRGSGLGESSPVKYDVLMVDKKVVGEEGKGGDGGGGGGRPEFRNVFEVVKEIQVQFERAANAGGEVGSVLEVGKLRYQRKNGALQVSARMLNVITPSLPSTSRDEGSLEVDEEVQLRSKNLSAILQKLYLWEKKLLEEVKAEEELRVKHDRKSLKLNRMIERGAEPLKIEATRSDVRNLSTKIRIAIQIVDKISLKINKLRDEELWPQLNVFIQGLTRMWKAMLECHRSQWEAIDGARGLDALAFPINPSDTHLEASLQFEHDLLNWTLRFTEWIGAQKGYVNALNGWLMKCILYEPEETDDGLVPFSPGRAGAPPVFVICNQWSQSLERISETSEKELIDSMRGFSMMVLQFRERDKGELRQRMTANWDMERKVKNIEKEDIKMQKKMVLASGDSDGLALSGNVVYQSDTSSNSSLQAGLQNIFQALKRFAEDSLKSYEDLLQRSEEVVREHGKVSQ